MLIDADTFYIVTLFKPYSIGHHPILRALYLFSDTNHLNMPSLTEEATFTGPEETHVFAGVLCDMDGTIVDSTDAIIKHWHKSVTQGWLSKQDVQ